MVAINQREVLLCCKPRDFGNLIFIYVEQRDGFGLHSTTSGDISKSIHTISSEILADLDVFNEICYGVAHKLIDSSYRNAILIY